jgi:HK97 family phage major capsid protein
MSYVEGLIEARQKAWHQAKELLDTAAAEKRELTAEEEQSFARINEDLDRRGAIIDDIKKAYEREERTAESIRGIESAVRPSGSYSNDADTLRALARGDIRSATFMPNTESRAIAGASTGAPVPTSFYNQVIAQARLVGPMLDTSTVLNTQSGENLQIPRLSTYSTATVSTATAAIATSDPTFSAFITLGAFKYSFITQVALELLSDSGVDFSSFLATETGNAVGYAVNVALTTGTGTVQPNGVVTQATVGGTTAGTAVIATDDLISLYYSLDGAARLLPGVGWQMNGKTISQVRRLKASTSGVYLWTPSLSDASPDTILGKPVYENPAMVDVASASKSVIVGHLPSYYVRQAGGLQFDRSDDFAFNQGLATFRAQLRVDGNLPQTGHIKSLLTL